MLLRPSTSRRTTAARWSSGSRPSACATAAAAFDGDVWAALATPLVGLGLVLVPAFERRIAHSELLRVARGRPPSSEAAPLAP